MTQFSRRQWLKFSGLASAATVLPSSVAVADHAFEKLRNPLALQDDLVRLSANENPYGPSPKVREAMTKGFDVLCRYPGMFEEDVKALLAKKHGVTTDHILLTAGSREGLKISGLTFGLNGGEIVAADPVYKALLVYAENLGAYIHRVPVDENLQHDLEAMARRVTQNVRMVFVCNPNNPTGTLLPAEKLKDFCHHISKKTVVFADEVYYDYIPPSTNYPSMIELVKRDLNVVVARTFSKIYGLAGVRLGYLIAPPDIILRLKKNIVASPNTLALFAGKAALQDEEFYHFSLKKNEEFKTRLYKVLEDLNLKYEKSYTNFVFFKTGRNIENVIEDMKAQGVRVGRPFPPLTNWCRVSTGTLEEMDQLEVGLRKVFA